jgi:hypothetical protein
VIEQPGAEDLGGQRQRGVVRVEVERGDRDDAPQRGDDRVVLAVPAQEVAERPRVERQVARVEPLERQSAADRPQPVGRAEQAVPDQGRGEVTRGRDAAGAGQPRAPPVGAQHRDVQAALQHDVLLRAEPAQQPPIGVAAAQEHVLAVVDRELAAPERERRTAEARAPFEQHHRLPGIGQAQGRRDAGQPPADDYCLSGHGHS